MQSGDERHGIRCSRELDHRYDRHGSPLGRMDGLFDFRCEQLQVPVAQIPAFDNYYCDVKRRNVLLMLKPLISREKNVESALSLRQQRAVL